MLPLNPFQCIQNHLNAAATAWIERIVPEPDIFSRIFATAIQWGTIDVPSSMLSLEPRAWLIAATWNFPEHSPGLKAVTQLVPVEVESLIVPSSDQPTALQVLASSSVATQHRNVLVPLDTTTVRRSNRSNKYDGFKINQDTDTKRSKSRVKPRETSFITAVSLAAAPVQVRSDDCPPSYDD